MFVCAQICVEVDLEKGLSEAIKLKLDDWTHIQKVYYENSHLNARHVMNMATSPAITKNKPKHVVIEVEPSNDWKQVRKKSNTWRNNHPRPTIPPRA
jgi:hypothetical protein